MARTAAVVGGGVGGLCTAIGLSRAGWDVTVLERWPRIVGIGAGIGVWPDAQRALFALGLETPFRAAAIDFGPSSIFTASGRRLTSLPSDLIERREGMPVRILSRARLIDLLAGCACDLCDVSTDVDIAAHQDVLRSADVVIGADGLRSAVRESMFPSRSSPVDTGFVTWRASVAFELAPAEYGETWGDGALVGLTRLSPGHTNVYVARRDDGIEWTQTRERFEKWRRPIPKVLAAIDESDVLRHPIADLQPHLPSFVHERSVLVGDAAHAMTPNLGRGACEAIIDAIKLTHQLASANDVETALQNYDSSRRRATQKSVERSRRMLRISTTGRPMVRNTLIRAVSPFIS